MFPVYLETVLETALKTFQMSGHSAKIVSRLTLDHFSRFLLQNMHLFLKNISFLLNKINKYMFSVSVKLDQSLLGEDDSFTSELCLNATQRAEDRERGESD